MSDSHPVVDSEWWWGEEALRGAGTSNKKKKLESSRGKAQLKKNTEK